MPFTLSALPYDESALEPAISSRTVGLHYHKHHKTYVDTLNALVRATKFADMRLEEVVHATLGAKSEKEKKVFNNAGQVWNHDFYWRSLSPKPQRPSGKLGQAIERDFGGLGDFNNEFEEAAAGQFLSGWVCLTPKSGKLGIDATG